MIEDFIVLSFPGEHCNRILSISHLIMSTSTAVPNEAAGAILKPSDPVPLDAVSVEGPNFEKPLSLQDFLGSYERIGFQANSLGRAIKIVNKMVCP